MRKAQTEDKDLKKSRVFLVLIVLILCIASLTACSRAEQYFVYGTTLEIQSYGIKSQHTVTEIYDYISSLESVLSPTVEGSDVSKINAAKVGEAILCQDVTMQIMRVASEVFEASDGAYDPSIYPLVRLWKFSGDLFSKASDFTPPSDEEIENAKRLVGLDKAFVVDYENSTITKLIDGAMLDFGGVAKGYAVQQSLTLASDKTLVNLGGNIGTVKGDFNVGIANPQREGREFINSYFAKFKLLSGECVSTSGDYERYYVVDDGERKNVYHHIINPITGKPADTSGSDGVVSCSVVTKDGAIGDAVATAVVVLGKEKGVQLLKKLGLKGFIIDGDMNVQTVGDFDVELKTAAFIVSEDID